MTPITEADIAALRAELEEECADPLPLVESVPRLLDEVQRLRAALDLVDPVDEPPSFAVCGANGGGRCASCGAWLAPAEPVAMWREGEHWALLHWGRCPAPELWRVEYQFNDTPQTWHPVMLALEDYAASPRLLELCLPYEEAYARARTTRTDAPRHHRPSRVRLVRAPKDTAP